MECREGLPGHVQSAQDLGGPDANHQFARNRIAPPELRTAFRPHIANSEDPAELLRTAIALGVRYMGPERGAEFGRRNAVPGELVVRVRPTKILGGLNMTG